MAGFPDNTSLPLPTASAKIGDTCLPRFGDRSMIGLVASYCNRSAIAWCVNSIWMISVRPLQDSPDHHQAHGR